jgi:hypothetical protein
MSETMSHAPSPKQDFSDRLSELMRNAGAESDPFAPIGAETSAPATPVHVENVEGKLATLRELSDAGSEPSTPVEAEESSPIFDQLTAEQNGTAVEIDPSASNVELSTSRIGNLLRNSGDLADNASEKLSDTKELAKTKLRSFGRAALRAARASRELGAGVKAIATEKALDVADRVDAAAMRGVEAVATKTKDTYNGAIDKTLEGLDKGADYVGDKMIALKEGAKEKLIAKKEAAKTRRQARRERWSQRWTSTKESVKSGYDKSGDALMSGFAKLENGADVVGNKMISAKDKASEKAERARLSVAKTRAIGRAAIDARR